MKKVVVLLAICCISAYSLSMHEQSSKAGAVQRQISLLQVLNNMSELSSTAQKTAYREVLAKLSIEHFALLRKALEIGGVKKQIILDFIAMVLPQLALPRQELFWRVAQEGDTAQLQDVITVLGEHAQLYKQQLIN